MKRLSLLSLILVLGLTFVALPACGDEEDEGSAPANNSAANNSTANNSTANNSTANNSTANNSTANNNTVPACLETGEPDCFSNYDCPDGSICMDVAAEGEDPLPCCVAGTAGSGAAGAACTQSADCATSVCIEGDAAQQCSDICESDAECPATMTCFGVFGIDDMWCYPRRPCTEDFDCSNGDTCQDVEGTMLCKAP